jgi:signal transduction histidine kinase
LQNAQAPLPRILVVEHARLERIDAWLLTGRGAAVQALGRSGLAVALAQRPLSGSTPAWRVTLPQGPSTLLLRIQSRTLLQPQVSLWSPAAQALDLRRADMRLGLGAGSLTMATLLALVFALWLRESTWAWYGAAGASMVLYQACYSGQALLWLWPGHPQWTLPAMSLALAGAHTSWVMFLLRFIPATHVSTWGRAGALALVGLSVLSLPLGFEIGIGMQELVGLLMPVVLPWVAWQAWRSGYAPARFMLLSFGLLAVASLLRVAILHGMLPSTPWLEHWFDPLAAALTSAVLMLALADRLRVLGREQASAAQRHQETLQERIREATDDMVQARDLAQAAVQFKSRFLARVSHDLRTPLHTLLGNAALAQRCLDQLPTLAATQRETLQASVQAMQRSASDMLQLSDELLELVRGEEGRLSLACAPTHLPSLVQEVEESTRWLAQHQGNRLRLEIDLGLDWVLLDAARVKQVLGNLLANACAATRDGVVTLGLRSAVDGDGARLEWWVGDTGRGIAPHALDRIFEPFEQLNAASATGSSGLGLAIARQWVRLMGSDVLVQSTPGRGSRFSWSQQVPLAAAPTRVDALAPAAGVNLSVAPLQAHVLVVDDVPDHRLFLQRLLHSMGLQVSLARSGHEAAQLLQDTQTQPGGRIDLVITDQNMPDGDGLWLLRWCREQRSALAVVALSSQARPSGQFDACLLKPVSPAELRGVLQRLLPPHLDWLALRALAEAGDGLGVDAWLTQHREQLGEGPLAHGALALGHSLQLAALVRWLA